MQILAKSAKFHNAEGGFEKSKLDLVLLASTLKQLQLISVRFLGVPKKRMWMENTCMCRCSKKKKKKKKKYYILFCSTQCSSSSRVLVVENNHKVNDALWISNGFNSVSFLISV